MGVRIIRFGSLLAALLAGNRAGICPHQPSLPYDEGPAARLRLAEPSPMQANRTLVQLAEAPNAASVIHKFSVCME